MAYIQTANRTIERSPNLCVDSYIGSLNSEVTVQFERD